MSSTIIVVIPLSMDFPCKCFLASIAPASELKTARALLKADSSKFEDSVVCTILASSRSVANRSMLLSASSVKLRGRRRILIIYLPFVSEGSEFLWLLRLSMVGDRPGN